MKFFVKENVLGLPTDSLLCLIIILYCMSVFIALVQVFLEPTPIACSAAIGRVKRFDIICVGMCLLWMCRLSFCLGSKCICASANISVDCAGGFRFA